MNKELQELDRNTVQYMIDEMQDVIDASNKTIAEQNQQLMEQNQQLSAQNLASQLYQLLSRDGRLEELGRAVTDSAFREQLFAEYQLHL